jgi:hypothetical protein
MYNAKYARVLDNENELVDLLKRAVCDIVGPEVIGLDALERVTSEAVNKGYKSKLVPILVHSNDEEFVNSLSQPFRTLNPRVVRVAAGDVESENLNPLVSIEEVNEDNVGNALKEIATKA